MNKPLPSPAGSHFIPLRKEELLSLLTEQAGLSLSAQGQFTELCRMIDQSIHFHYHQRLDRLKVAYAPFDPDADERMPVPSATAFHSANNEVQAADEVFDLFGELLERANFRRLSQEQIEETVITATNLGMKLKADFSLFERLEVYVRGEGIERKQRKSIRKGFQPEELEVPTHERLAVILRLKPGEETATTANRHSPSTQPLRPILMKLFKNIPQGDVEMLLPGTEVQMTLLDQGRIWLPTLSGLGMTLYKLVQGALWVAFASFYGLLAFLGLVGGAIGYGISAFFGYIRTRDKYHLNLTRSLYFQNLDNNAGVFFRLLDEAEDQEFREAVLAFWLLWQQGNDDGGWTAPQIDLAAEEFLRQRCGLEVDFEVEDALDKLRKINLVEQLPGKKYRALALQAAITEMDRQWDQVYSPEQSNRVNKRNFLRILQAA